MLKYSWEVSNGEKERILKLHESATKNHYINEQVGQEQPKQISHRFSLMSLPTNDRRNNALDSRYNEQTGLVVDYGDGEFIKTPSKEEIEGGYQDSGELINKLIQLKDENYLSKPYVPTYQKFEDQLRFLWLPVIIQNNLIKPDGTGLTFKG